MNNNDNAFLLWISKVYLYNPIKHIFISSTQAAGGLNELKHRTDVTNAEYLMCDVQSVRCLDPELIIKDSRHQFEFQLMMLIRFTHEMLPLQHFAIVHEQ